MFLEMKEELTMFFKKPLGSAQLDSPGTIIGKGVYLEAARMTGHETIRIEGMYKGSIDVEGSLVLGEGGSITGNVNADYFLVAGEVIGNIKCTTQLHFASTAKIEGDVQTASLIMDEGSHVSGRYIVGAERLPKEALESQEYDERLHIQSADNY